MKATFPLRKRLLAVAATTAAVAFAAPAVADPPPANDAETVFIPAANQDFSTYLQLVVTRSASVQAQLLETDLAAAEAQQARLLGNPQLDASWGTIPIGPTNPEGLSPLTDVPNYGVGISYTFPIGKRGPRRRRADALHEASRAALGAAVREQVLDLTRTLGSMALAIMRIDGLRGLLGEETNSIALAKTRLAGGFGTPLDVDRLEIERSRTEQQVISDEGNIRAAAATCASYVGMRCRAFPASDDARQFLTSWIERALAASGPLEERPDVRALEAYGRAADAEADLARAQAIPDPTVRLGYLYDQFVISGNQRQSLNLSVSIPLPIFDYGQAQLSAAEARQKRFAAQRQRLLTTGRARIEALREALDVQQKRRERITTEMLPRARAVVADLEKAANNRLIPLTDVIQARRTLSELLLEETESYGDAFQAAMDLLAELPAAPGTLEAAVRGSTR